MLFLLPSGPVHPLPPPVSRSTRSVSPTHSILPGFATAGITPRSRSPKLLVRKAFEVTSEIGGFAAYPGSPEIFLAKKAAEPTSVEATLAVKANSITAKGETVEPDPGRATVTGCPP